MVRIETVDASGESFANDFKRLAPEIKVLAAKSISDLQRDPMPKRLRFEKLSGYRNPSIYTIHVTSNHSHKASFELVGTMAVLRRIGTHKEIDRAP